MDRESDGDVTAYATGPLPRVETEPDPAVEALVHKAKEEIAQTFGSAGPLTESTIRRAVEAGRELGRRQAFDEVAGGADQAPRARDLDVKTAPAWTSEWELVARDRTRSARTFAEYHAQQASYGGASFEFHARAETWIRSIAEDLTAALAEIERLRTLHLVGAGGGLSAYSNLDVFEARRARIAELERARHEDMEAAGVRLNQLALRVQELEQALRVHGSHRPSCAVFRSTRSKERGHLPMPDPGPCDCGLESALQSLGPEHTSPAGWEDRVREAVAVRGEIGVEGPLEVDVGSGVARLLAGSRSCRVVRDADAERVTITDAGRAALREDSRVNDSAEARWVEEVREKARADLLIKGVLGEDDERGPVERAMQHFHDAMDREAPPDEEQG